MKILLFLVSLVVFGNCGENSVSINVKNVANIISDRFISYEAKFSDLMNLFLEQKKSFENLNLISPSFLKLEGLSAYLADEHRKYDEVDVATVFERLGAHQIIPIVTVEYQSISFDPLSLMNELKKAQSLKIKDCIWQLGDNSVSMGDILSVKKYSEDLKTMKILCESVNKEHNLNWSVAADMNLRQVERLPFEVAGVEVKKMSTGDVISKLVIARSKFPTWVTIDSPNDKEFNKLTKMNSTNFDTCDEECLTNGLVHAQVLGEAAKKGFNVLIFNETAQQSGKSNFFKQAVSILHKKLVGNKVFNVRVTKSSIDGKSSSLYSHCSKKTNGAVTLMGINFSNMRSKFNVKISTPMESSATVLQYLLSAIDGHVLLNNERFSYNVTPSYKFKKLSKYSISLVLPPFSMAFWTIKNTKVNECLNFNSMEGGQQQQIVLSSSEQLLKKLVANEFEGKQHFSNKLEKATRIKRQVANPNSFLPGLEWEFPFKFPNLMASASNQKPSVLFNKNIEVYKVGAPEPNPLQASDNPTLPKGDVYLLINDGKRPAKLAAYDYVTDDQEQLKTSRRKPKANKIVLTTESPDYFIPHDYIDASQKTTKKISKKSATKSTKKQPQEIGELFEAEHIPVSSSSNNDQRSHSSNVELTTVVKELPPTFRQSKSVMRAAKSKYDSGKILEFLKEANLEEVVDKSQLGNVDDFEMIDLTENADTPNYEQYEDEEDDEFFRSDSESDSLHHIRTRRNVDFAKNEIPKYGNHFIDDDEDSIETLTDDVHLYLQPHQPRSEITKEATNDVRKTAEDVVAATEASTTIKAIDFFSKSLGDVLNVAHKTFVGWWYVFNPNGMSQY